MTKTPLTAEQIAQREAAQFDLQNRLALLSGRAYETPVVASKPVKKGKGRELRRSKATGSRQSGSSDGGD